MPGIATSSRGKSWIRRIQRPWVSLLLLAYLVVNANMQPPHYTRGGVTLVGGLCSSLRGDARITSQPPVDYFFLKQENGVWVVRLDDFIWTQQGVPAGVVVLRHNRVQSARGVWSPTVETRRNLVSIVDLATNAPITNAQQRIAVVNAVAANAWSTLTPGRVAYYANGGSDTRRILWKGVANDARVILAAALLVCSLGWMRWKRRTPDGKCPKCGYDLTGLTSRRCPECGVFLADAGEPAAAER